MSENIFESNALNDLMQDIEEGNNTLFSDFPQADDSSESAASPIGSSKAFAPPALIPPEEQVPTQTETTDSLSLAVENAKKLSLERQLQSYAEKNPYFSYAEYNDEITNHEISFEALRQKYEIDIPALSDPKKVSWSVRYGSCIKNITNPGDRIFDVKKEIELSKKFNQEIGNLKPNAKPLVCQVVPRIIAGSKGEAKVPDYKGYSNSIELARASSKPLEIFPGKDGNLYEMRKNKIGVFTAPAVSLPGDKAPRLFEFLLPKIPFHLILMIIAFFRKCDRTEALVHILYDTRADKYVVRVPKQKASKDFVSFSMPFYPEHLIHVMDIHSHGKMPALFSKTDNQDETETRLYAVIGCLHHFFPVINVRASCGGKYIPVNSNYVFENAPKGYSYPERWETQVAKAEPVAITEGKNYELS